MSLVRFSERQRFRQWWLWLVAVATAGIGWAAFVQQIVLGRPFGDEPASDAGVWLLFVTVGVGLPALFLVLELRTEVTDHHLRVRFRPFRARVVPLDTILDAQVVDYRPVAHWGGWGYRTNLRGGRAFTVSGTRGVRLALPRDRVLLVGSGRAEELHAAIVTARG